MVHVSQYPLSSNHTFKEISDAELSVYPNPFNEMFVLEFTENIRTQYSLFNIMGIQLMSGKTEGQITHIDTNTLPSGVYFIKVDGKTKMICKTEK